MRTSLFTLAMVALLTRTGDAHRLDEYLQATRIDVTPDAVVLEIDLTPGVSVAPGVIALIDTNHDGRLSSVEEETYAQRALQDMAVDIDRTRLTLSLNTAEFPPVVDVLTGVGTIRLTARATFRAASGTRELVYRNGHRRDIGVYLANPLVPRSRRIAIIDQQRDATQHELRITFTVSEPQTLLERVKQFAARIRS